MSVLRPPYRIVRQADEIGDPVVGQLEPADHDVQNQIEQARLSGYWAGWRDAWSARLISNDVEIK